MTSTDGVIAMGMTILAMFGVGYLANKEQRMDKPAKSVGMTVKEIRDANDIEIRYFTSSLERIKRVEVDTNKRGLTEMWVTWNEVYSEIGLKPSKFGESVGWNVDIELEFSSCIGDDGWTYLVVDHYNRPVTFTGNEQL